MLFSGFPPQMLSALVVRLEQPKFQSKCILNLFAAYVGTPYDFNDLSATGFLPCCGYKTAPLHHSMWTSCYIRLLRSEDIF